jgi:hypothetical protein
MINVVVADIFSFMLPGFLGEVMAGSAAGFPITQGLLLVFAIIMEIPNIGRLLIPSLLFFCRYRGGLFVAHNLVCMEMAKTGSMS